MKSQFCEKEFEILFCREFINLFHCDLCFPSAKQEERKGFDARFKHKKFKAVFFQFKVVEEYVRKNTWNFHFPTHATRTGEQKQHNTLVKLNSKQPATHPVAFYVVPNFIERKVLIQHSRIDKLLKNCKYLYPLYPLNKGTHHIRFNNTRAAQYSKEPQDMGILQSAPFENAPELDFDSLNALFPEKEDLFSTLVKNRICLFYKGMEDDLDEDPVHS